MSDNKEQPTTGNTPEPPKRERTICLHIGGMRIMVSANLSGEELNRIYDNAMKLQEKSEPSQDEV